MLGSAADRRLWDLHMGHRPDSFWPMSDPAGSTTVRDRGYNGYTGTLVNASACGRKPVAPSDARGAGVRLNANPQSVTCGDVYDFVGTAPFTLTGWFWPELHPGYNSRAICKSNTASANSQYEVIVNYGVSTNFARANVGLLAAPSVIGAPNHFAMIYDGASHWGILNGRVWQTANANTANNQATSLRFAANQDGFVTMQGRISQYAIWSRALRVADMLEIWRCGMDLPSRGFGAVTALPWVYRRRLAA